MLNPGEEEARVRVDYFFQGAETLGQDLIVPAGRRATIYVNQVVGPGRDVAVKVASPQGIVAERAMYFLYHDAWDGGHDTLGMSP